MQAEVNGALQLTLINSDTEGVTVEWFAIGTDPRIDTTEVQWDSPRPRGLEPNGRATVILHDSDGNPAKGVTVTGPFLTVTMPAVITLKGKWPSAGRIGVGGCAEVYLGEEAETPYVAAFPEQLEEF